METAAVIIVLGAAAIAAALGFAAAWAARRWMHVAYPAYWFAGGGAALGAIAAAVVLSGTGASLLASGEQLKPGQVLTYMKDIRRYDAALAERIETSIIRDQEDGKSADEVRTNAKALVSSYVADKIPFLPDDLTYELYATTRDILSYLLLHGEASTCADVALGRFRGDIDPKLSADLVERNNNVTVRVIATRANKDAEKMKVQDFTAFASAAFVEAAQIADVPQEQVDKLLAGEGDPGKTCKLMKGFINVVLSQPVNVAASALRTLASGGARPT